MAVERLSDGKVWIWSPVAIAGELAAAVKALGPVSHIVSPNKIHHLFLAECTDRWPEARLCALHGLACRKPDLQFHAELGDTPDPGW